MWHMIVTDYGLYMPTDGHQSLFSSMFVLLLQYLVKYIELCASRWSSATVKPIEQWHRSLFIVIPLWMHAKYRQFANKCDWHWRNTWSLLLFTCLRIHINSIRLINEIIAVWLWVWRSIASLKCPLKSPMSKCPRSSCVKVSWIIVV